MAVRLIDRLGAMRTKTAAPSWSPAARPGRSPSPVRPVAPVQRHWNWERADLVAGLIGKAICRSLAPENRRWRLPRQHLHPQCRSHNYKRAVVRLAFLHFWPFGDATSRSTGELFARD